MLHHWTMHRNAVVNKLSQDHPQRDHVNLVGEVIFPNLTLSSTAALASIWTVTPCLGVCCLQLSRLSAGKVRGRYHVRL